ncbi:MAG: threonine synthase [Oscillospiraceae bacterium]|nr:threonine synthase [Oscillospiraceae bacterium]
MYYHSTRDHKCLVSGTAAILQGIAPDGGLYVPEAGRLPKLDYQSICMLPVQEMASAVMGALLPEFPPEEMAQLVANAYSGRFETEDLTPTVPVGDNYVLELFRGPTSAFKDVALCMLPQLVTASRAYQDVQDEIVILTATSGDTGKAALEGFRDVPGTKIIVFFPDEGVSKVQKAQMTTQQGGNVKVCAIRGNFDDAQTGVKNVFAACAEQKLLDGRKVRLSSANSINIGRLIPQTVYYFKAYGDVVRSGRITWGETLDYVVPTGNFGNILAGYLAKQMGLPVGRLVCASNDNDVLTEFLRTGRYDRNRPFHKTISPSMDILVSSNLERLLYLTEKDTEQVAGLMAELKEKGWYQVPDSMLRIIEKDFWAGCCDEASTKETIGRVFADTGYLMDTHTAVAWNVAEQYRAAGGDRPMVILSTASAYKFPEAVLQAIGSEPAADEFDTMERLAEKSGAPIPANLAGLRQREVLHKDVIGKDEILQYVLSYIAK